MNPEKAKTPLPRLVAGLWSALLVAGAMIGICKGQCQEIPAGVIVNAKTMAVSNYLAFGQQFRMSPSPDATVMSRFARACYERAEWATNKAERAVLAEEGIRAAERALKVQTNSADAWYNLGLNLGQLARTKHLGALPIVDRMVVIFHRAAALDSRLEHAGPDRSLGILHRDAPAIGSVGSRKKSRQHLERAARLEPDYPGNRLALAESCFRWRDFSTARRELLEAERIWEPARKNLTGPEWELSWHEWELRLAELKQKLEETKSSKPRQP